MERLKTKFIAAWVTVALLALSGCSGLPMQKCTSTDRMVCDLQNRIYLLEMRHNATRKHPPAAARQMTDDELLNELRRRQRAATFPLPE